MHGISQRCFLALWERLPKGQSVWGHVLFFIKPSLAIRMNLVLGFRQPRLGELESLEAEFG